MIAKQNQGYIKDALFVSYTALKDFLRCPKAYYLKNRYRDPKSGYRLQIASGPMTLGSLVHDAIKWYLQTNRQASEDEVINKYRNHWLKYRGKKGGFTSREEEGVFGKRGIGMLQNFLANTAILEPNIPIYDFLRYQLDPKIIFTGKVDFIGNLSDESLHILDFKTSTKDEEDATQLHSYAIMAESSFQKPVSRLSYWYLERDNSPKEAVLDSLEEKIEWLGQRGLEIQQAIADNNWVCIEKEGPYNECQKYQAIIDGKGEFQFSDDDFKKDIYFLSSE